MRILLFLLFISIAADSNAQSYRVSEAISSGALDWWFVLPTGEAPGGDAGAILSLQEALESGALVIRETNDHTLRVENLSGRTVFIKSGEIIKGGQQDRVVAESVLVPPGAEQLPLSVYCAEKERSFQRPPEPITHFSTSDESLSLPAASQALVEFFSEAKPTKDSGVTAAPISVLEAEMLAALTEIPRAAYPERERSQAQVWGWIADVQKQLAQKFGDTVYSKRSKTSLLLTLENALVSHYIDSLREAAWPAIPPEAIGYAYAIGGELQCAEIFGGPALFGFHFRKALRAAIVDALMRGGVASRKALQPEEILDFLETPKVPAVPRATSIASKSLLQKAGGKVVITTQTMDIPGKSIHTLIVRARQ